MVSASSRLAYATLRIFCMLKAFSESISFHSLRSSIAGLVRHKADSHSGLTNVFSVLLALWRSLLLLAHQCNRFRCVASPEHRSAWVGFVRFADLAAMLWREWALVHYGAAGRAVVAHVLLHASQARDVMALQFVRLLSRFRRIDLLDSECRFAVLSNSAADQLHGAAAGSLAVLRQALRKLWLVGLADVQFAVGRVRNQVDEHGRSLSTFLRSTAAARSGNLVFALQELGGQSPLYV